MALSSDDVWELVKTGAFGTAAAILGRSAWRQIHRGVVVTSLTWRFAISELVVGLFSGYVGVGVARWMNLDKETFWLPPLLFGYFGIKFVEDLVLRYRDRELPAPATPAAPVDPEPPKE